MAIKTMNRKQTELENKKKKPIFIWTDISIKLRNNKKKYKNNDLEESNYLDKKIWIHIKKKFSIRRVFIFKIQIIYKKFPILNYFLDYLNLKFKHHFFLQNERNSSSSSWSMW